MSGDILKNVEVEEEKVETTSEAKDVIPAITDANWHEYVMSHFQPDELIDGNPTTDGLRRVAQLILGDIIKSSSHCVLAPTPENNYGSTVEHTVVFNWRLDDNIGGDIRTFTEIADVHQCNTEPEFLKHSSATASTRAEGRALRKALKLKYVVAAEEVTEVTMGEEILAIKSNQINIINMLCSRHNINVIKFINMGSTKYSRIEDVTYITASKMISKLNDFAKDASTIPEHIVGFDKDWRN